MWKVECARCGEVIEAEYKSEIKTDENDNPRHENCPYADEPSYPLSFNVKVKLSYSLDEIMKTNFPHLTPKIDKGMNYPGDFRNIGSHSIGYRVRMPEGGDNIWDAKVIPETVDNVPLANRLPRLVYECEGCGTRVEGKIHYITDGHLPFTHESCKYSDNEFKPVDFSHLDRTVTEEEEEEVLERYKEKYN